MKLSRAFRFATGGCAAFAGAGGKTTAMFQLARELEPPVLLTATSRLGAWQIPLADHHLILDPDLSQPSLPTEWSGVTLLTGPIEAEKTMPIDERALHQLREIHAKRSIPLLIEADGSRGKPLKAPGEHEPPVPVFASLVVQVAGLSGLGQPIDEEHVHRPAQYNRISGTRPGDKVDIETMSRVLLHPEGGLKNIPESARRVLLLNQADTGELQAAAGGVSARLLEGYDAVVTARLSGGEVFSVHERVAGVVLAAGGSQRFGRPKQLLDWQGEPFVRAVARTALSAGLSPVLVITGADREQVAAAVSDLPVQVLDNPGWQEGQASSIRVAAAVLSGGGSDTRRRTSPGAAIFLLVDQPQVSVQVLRALVEGRSTKLPSILAPLVMDRRANPVLFDRRIFPDLLDLQGDLGGRALFTKHTVEYLPWHDDSLLLDVDTPEQYARLLALRAEGSL